MGVCTLQSYIQHNCFTNSWFIIKQIKTPYIEFHIWASKCILNIQKAKWHTEMRSRNECILGNSLVTKSFMKVIHCSLPPNLQSNQKTIDQPMLQRTSINPLAQIFILKSKLTNPQLLQCNNYLITQLFCSIGQRSSKQFCQRATSHSSSTRANRVVTRKNKAV